MTCTTLPPFNVVSIGDGFRAFNPPIMWIVLHLLEDFVSFAYEYMILNVIAYNKRTDQVMGGVHNTNL